MSRRPRFWGIHAQPPRRLKLLLGLAPLVCLVAVYLTVSHIRLSDNPRDKLTPSVGRMAESVRMLAFERDSRTGEYTMLQDTASSLRRLAIGLGSAAIFGLFCGLNMGMLPGMGAMAAPTMTFLSIVPPLSILPILFIIFGVGEVGKIMLIFLGAAFVITRDIYFSARDIPIEQKIKALTLGASQFQLVYEVVLPQIMPRLLVTIRLSLGAAWLFLIASEAIASTDGLGYRIFLVRRYLSMDVIIPYVLWITLLGFVMDMALRRLVQWKYPWYGSAD